ncbi:MAG TPA: carboxypeptidase-like regulatory domain-containing protein, partial [Kofleriaceae bacterium]|nr:carboxypeptidase-like regulatory domain-containing protein [Kofleriaceae bacterium]
MLANRNRSRRAAVVGAAMVAAVGLALLVGLSRCDAGGRAASVRDPAGARNGDAARAAVAAPASVADPASRRSLFGQRNVARRRIAGRVSEAGAPVANARVSLRWAGMEAGMVPPAPIATDAAGRFDLGLWFAERFTVSAAADGKTAAVVEIDLRDPTAAPPPDQLELVLTPCAHKLVGTVSDGSGGPIAGAAVARLRAAPVATAADGAYALCLA